MWKLVIEDDEGKRTVVPLTRDDYTIGRKEGNTIRLTERNVSRAHAKIRKLTNGAAPAERAHYLLEDQQSYNGVYVNGIRVAQTQELGHGDLVQIGDYRIVLQDDAVIEAPSAVAARREDDASPSGQRASLADGATQPLRDARGADARGRVPARRRAAHHRARRGCVDLDQPQLGLAPPLRDPRARRRAVRDRRQGLVQRRAREHRRAAARNHRAGRRHRARRREVQVRRRGADLPPRRERQPAALGDRRSRATGRRRGSRLAPVRRLRRGDRGRGGRRLGLHAAEARADRDHPGRQ